MNPNYNFPTGNKPGRVTFRMANVAPKAGLLVQEDVPAQAAPSKLVKQRTATAMEKANRYGIGIVHVFNPNYPKGGLTIAFKKCNDYKSGYMVEVAVNTCSPEDTFNKRLGTAGAIEKFLNGHTIELPILRTYDAEDINGAVKEVFTNMAHFMLLL